MPTAGPTPTRHILNCKRCFRRCVVDQFDAADGIFSSFASARNLKSDRMLSNSGSTKIPASGGIFSSAATRKRAKALSRKHLLQFKICRVGVGPAVGIGAEQASDK